MVIAKVFAGVGQVPGVGWMTEVALLLGPPRVIGPRLTGRRAEKKCRAKGGGENGEFEEPAHAGEAILLPF